MKKKINSEYNIWVETKIRLIENKPIYINNKLLYRNSRYLYLYSSDGTLRFIDDEEEINQYGELGKKAYLHRENLSEYKRLIADIEEHMERQKIAIEKELSKIDLLARKIVIINLLKRKDEFDSKFIDLGYPEDMVRFDIPKNKHRGNSERGKNDKPTPLYKQFNKVATSYYESENADPQEVKKALTNKKRFSNPSSFLHDWRRQFLGISVNELKKHPAFGWVDPKHTSKD